MGGHAFTIDLVQRLVAAFDMDNSGQIGTHEPAAGRARTLCR